MSEDLTKVAAFADEASAEVLAGMLRSEDVPVEVRPISPLPGIVDEVQVYVPASLAHRARRFINSSEVTDAELNFAATGELGGENKDYEQHQESQSNSHSIVDSGSYEDISLMELKSFAGDDDYPKQWLTYLRADTRLAGFNGWAAIFGLAWFVYRKLYVQGFIAIVLETVVPAMVGAAAVVLMGASEGIAYGFVVPITLIAVRVAFGFWANLALCNKAVHAIREVDELNLDNEAHLEMIAAAGGVNIPAFFIAFGVVGLIDRFLLLGL